MLDYKSLQLALALKPYPHIHILGATQGGIMAIKVFDKCHDIADPGLTVKSFTTSLTHVKYHSFRLGN